ncbi:MAG: hypothetical protein LQ346_007257 [Caloplaca aetnensis]|nr:MAG: hypothetical protein LQ346_007257 [Caloplaca aetnensis]
MTTVLTFTDKSLPPLTLQLYSATSISTKDATLLPSLTALINLCYSVSHTSGPHGNYLPYAYQRLLTPTSLIDEVGKDGFIFVLTIQTPESEQKLIASASAKPFRELEHYELAQGSELATNFKRRAAAPGLDAAARFKPLQTAKSGDPTVAVDSLKEGKVLPKWEIVCNVVHPEYQRRGIAAQMYEALVKEMKNRVSAQGDQDVHLVITTMKELNEVYYQKRGFMTTGERRFEKGVGGSEVGFSVVEMEKIA